MRKTFLLVCCVWLTSICGALQASTIHDLAEKGDLARMKILLQRSPDLVNEKDEDDCTPLHIAAMYNLAEVASYLLDKGADLTAINAVGLTPLQHASHLRRTKIARLIISKSGKCDIYSAVMLGDETLVNKLLDADPKLVDAPDINGDTPLWSAAEFGYVGVAELLLNRGADVNACGPCNGSPLRTAVGSGHAEVVRLLLDRGADLTAPGNADLLDLTMSQSEKDTARLLIARGARISIFYAVYRKDLAKVTSLLDADPKLCNARECFRTPLCIAAERNATEIARLLISRGSDVNAGYSDSTPLSAAARTGSKEVALLLLARGAKISVPKGSDSPLHVAVANGRNDFARFLISKGAKIDAIGDYGFTPLSIAAQRGNKELAAFFISKKCAVNARDTFGATPLGWAAGKGHKDVAALLARHGGRKVMPPKRILEGGGMCSPLFVQ